MSKRTLPFPTLGFRRAGTINWDKVGKVTIVGVLIIVASAWLIGLSYKGIWWITKKPGPPPKVITRTVTLDKLSSEQRAFIKACTSAHWVPAGSDYDSYGIPDVHSNPWTCKLSN